MIGPEQSDLHLTTDPLTPSSQFSVPTFFPSPQIGVQTEGEVESPPMQLYPVGIDQHPVSHPIKEEPTSQTSAPTFSPSPQISEQVDGPEKLPPLQV